MGKKVEMIGRRFGRWLVTAETEKRGQKGAIVYHCVCDCGKEKDVNGMNLRNGSSTSCGCYNREIITKNGGAVYREHLYGVWNAMKCRCKNQKDKAYHNYGGRGIKVCREWRDNYLAFREWAYVNGYKRGLWLDRIDNDKEYSPTNCRWASTAEQARNKRSTRFVKYNGEQMCLTDAAAASGISFSTLSRRIELGWSEDRLFSPVAAKYSHGAAIKAAMHKHD